MPVMAQVTVMVISIDVCSHLPHLSPLTRSMGMIFVAIKVRKDGLMTKSIVVFRSV